MNIVPDIGDIGDDLYDENGNLISGGNGNNGGGTTHKEYEEVYTSNVPTSSDNSTLKINNYFVSIGGIQIKIGIQKIYSWTKTRIESAAFDKWEITTNYITQPKYGDNSSSHTITEQIQYKKNLDGSIRCWRFGPNSQNWSDNESINPWRAPGESFKDFG